MALSAAYRHAMEKYKGIQETMTKYMEFREKCIFAREFYRGIFMDVSFYLKPTGMPSHVLFQHPEEPSDNIGIFTGLIHTMQYKLQQIHVNPYYDVSQKALDYLALIERHIQDGKPQEVVRNELFAKANSWIRETLKMTASIYPKES
jgi:hypothetical protein